MENAEVREGTMFLDVRLSVGRRRTVETGATWPEERTVTGANRATTTKTR